MWDFQNFFHEGQVPTLCLEPALGGVTTFVCSWLCGWAAWQRLLIVLTGSRFQNVPSVIHQTRIKNISEMQKHKSISGRMNWWISKTQILQGVGKKHAYDHRQTEDLPFQINQDCIVTRMTFWFWCRFMNYLHLPFCLSSSLIRPIQDSDSNILCESRYCCIYFEY